MIARKAPYQELYRKLYRLYGCQGWWPIINNKTLICEYHTGAPRNEAEQFEIALSCVLAQGTQWYPNVVRALQQLKLGRPFTKPELEWIRQAEIERNQSSRNSKKATNKVRLTQNTSWRQAAKVVENLRKLSLLNPKKIIASEEKTLAAVIKPAGYFNQKAKKLRHFAKFYQKLRGRTPSREELLAIWGIGPETADSMLLYAYKVPTFVVDAYTKRILKSLGLINEKASYDEIKKLFEANLKPDLKMYQEFHALMVEHAKRQKD